MTENGKNLSETVAEEIISMITAEHLYRQGDKLPNENELSLQMGVSRTTLREAIRILAARQVVEIRRGKGTFVKNTAAEGVDLKSLNAFPADMKDLYEMRLIFEPQTAYFAAKRATDRELERILYYGRLEEELILQKQDRTEAEQAFHKAIARATHNEFMNRLMPILYRAIDQGVPLSDPNEEMVQNTLQDHHMIMEFLANRDAKGAKIAMQLHIIHAMRGFGIEPDE